MWMVLIRFVSTLSATARADGGRRNHVEKPALDTPSTRAIVTIGNTAWCALMNRKTRTRSCRSPVRTRPPLLPGSRAPDAAGGSHGADGPTQPAPPPEAHHRGGQHHVRLGAPNSRSLAPLARTRVTTPPAFGLTAPARPSGAEIPAHMAGDSLASPHPPLTWESVHQTGSTPLGQAIGSSVVFDLVGFDNGFQCRNGILLGLGHPDLLQRALGLGVQALWQLVQDVRGLVDPAALLAGGRPHLAKRLPEPKRTIGDRNLRRRCQPATLQIEQQITPRL